MAAAIQAQQEFNLPVPAGATGLSLTGQVNQLNVSCLMGAGGTQPYSIKKGGAGTSKASTMRPPRKRNRNRTGKAGGTAGNSTGQTQGGTKATRSASQAG
jgi:hypothetical protein